MPTVGAGSPGDSIEYLDGFDDAATSQLLRSWTTYAAPSAGTLAPTPLDSSCSIAAGAGRAGSAALRFSGGNRALALATSARSTRSVGFAFRVDRIAPSAIASFLDGAAIQCGLKLNADGTLSAIGGSGAVLGTSTRAITAGAQYHVQLRAAFSPAGGIQAVVGPDGSTWLSAGGSTIATGNAYADGVAIGPHDAIAGSIAWDYDDFWSDGAGTLQGDGLVGSHLPASDGPATQFARGGTNTGSNHGQVSDDPADDDATYVASAVAGDLDLYGYAGTPTGGAVIVAAQSMAVARATSAAENLALACYSGGAEHDGTARVVAPASYLAHREIWGSDPATGGAWTTAGLAAAKFGPRHAP